MAWAVLVGTPNSHPFEERTLSLENPVNIGRSGTRARAKPSNAFFDCTVISRDHAFLWYENGKVFLEDRNSTHGTFVNNQPLVEDTQPREVFSGDVLQFGVEVVATKGVTHGCIVASLILYLSDEEAKPTHSPSSSLGIAEIPSEELNELMQYLQEAIHREKMIDTKLTALRDLIGNTRESSGIAWKALVNEDWLLSRVETLENQFQISSKTLGKDRLLAKLRQLQEDKSRYQTTAKKSLQKVLQEKVDALEKLHDLEVRFSVSENECAFLKKTCDQGEQHLQDLEKTCSAQIKMIEDLTRKLEVNKKKSKETIEKLEQEKLELQERLKNQKKLTRELKLRLDALKGNSNDLQSYSRLMKSNEETEWENTEEGNSDSLGVATCCIA